MSLGVESEVKALVAALTDNTQLMSLDAFYECIASYLSTDECVVIERAYHFAERAHEGVFRKSGEAYITHPLSVTYILALQRMDVDTLCAALLHDVVEDTEYTLTQIEDEFGTQVMSLVDGVTKLDGKHLLKGENKLAANFQKLMQAMVRDHRVIIIKLADRLHNLSTLGVMRPEKKRRIARESLELFVPLARKLGMNLIRRRMQLLSFEHYYPRRYLAVKSYLQQQDENNATAHAEILGDFERALVDVDLNAEVFTWPHNLYAEYILLRQNTHHRRHRIKELHQLRVIVENENDCYLALGALHRLYSPRIKHFIDFIAAPKEYGFQALQTQLITPEKHIIKVQIQSRRMYYTSQYGITSLQLDGDEGSTGRGIDAAHIRSNLQNWLAEVSDYSDSSVNSSMFLDDVKNAMYTDEIHVNTPRGELIHLPRGATPVDFAYAIHTELGHCCAGCRVDGISLPLNTPLQHGMVVEIIRTAKPRPKLTWLDFVVTTRAKNAINAWMRQQSEADYVSLGKSLLENGLQRYKSSFDKIDEAHVSAVLKTLQVDDLEQLFSDIARGEQPAKLVSKRLLGKTHFDVNAEMDTPLVIKGTEGMPLHLAHCCYPVFGDEIRGVIAGGDGLEIHRSSCPQLTKHIAVRDVMRLSWASDKSQQDYLSVLEMMVENRPGVLNKITSHLADSQLNIDDISITGDESIKQMKIALRVKDKVSIDAILARISNMRSVIAVNRSYYLNG